MADTDDPGSQRVQTSRPAAREVESREETVARVAGAEEAVAVGRGGSADPSTRRGVQRVLWRNVLRAALAGAVAGAAVGLILYFLPGPREEGRGLGLERTGWANGLAYALIMAAALAVVAAVITAFVTLAREDGRVERDVEERTGHAPEGPGRPNRSGEDLDLR